MTALRNGSKIYTQSRNNQSKTGANLMTKLTITIKTGKNEAKFFFIEFKVADFDQVVEAVANVTLETVYNNPLWKVL